MDIHHHLQLVAYCVEAYVEHASLEGILVKNRIQKIPTIELLGQTFISRMSHHTRVSPYVSVIQRDTVTTTQVAR